MEIQKERIEIKTFLRAFWQFVSLFKEEIRKAVYWIIIIQILAVFEPFVVMSVIDGLHGKTMTVREHLELMLLGALVVLSFIGLVQVIKNRCIRNLCFGIECDLPIRCGEKLLRLQTAFHVKNNTTLLVGKVIRGIEKMVDLVAIICFEIVPLIIQTTVAAVIIAWHSSTATLVLVPVVIGFTLLTITVKMRMAKRRIRRHDLYSEVDEILGQAIHNVATVQAYRQEAAEIQRIKDIHVEIKRLIKEEFGEYDRNDIWRNMLVSFGRITVLYVCAYAVLHDVLSAGVLVFVTSLTERVFISCYRIGAVLDRTMEAIDPVVRMQQVLAEPETITDPIAPAPLPKRLSGHIELRNVTYTYAQQSGTNGHTQPTLKNVSLAIRAGETIGIVGSSGGGKSTLAKLFLRCDDPDSGEILFDGIDLRNLPLDFRRQIGSVSQEVEVFDRPVGENIALGKSNATREEIEWAARIGHAHEFITKLPHGYDEMIGNRGLKLSGGQRQRLGIARAVLIDPPILIFDEATSHVDLEGEQIIQQSVEKLRAGRTIIIIAHRLSTVRNADRIVVMSEGEIKEIGNHTELMRRCGLYHLLVSIQQDQPTE